MSIYRGLTPLKVYKGDMQPVNIYVGTNKVAGWHSASYSGASPLTVDCDYNVPPDALVVDGKCVQTPSCWSTNLITNGDFSNGTTGWASSTLTKIVSDGKLDATVTMSTTEHYADQVIIPSPVAGHKYYGRVYCEPVAGKACVQMYNRRSDGVYEQLFPSGIATPGISSGMLTVSSVYSVPSFIFRLRLLNSAGAVNFAGTIEETKFSYACLIDLTAAFGAGKEPTAAQMDAIMAQFPNSWFDGSAQLSTDTTTYTANSPSPSYPAPISTITENMTITGADGAASNTTTVAFGGNVCASLPDGTYDSYDAVTGVLTKRVGKAVFDGSADEGWSIRTGTNLTFYIVPSSLAVSDPSNLAVGNTLSDRFAAYSVMYLVITSGLIGIASGGQFSQIYIAPPSGIADLAAFRTWLAANPVTVYYKLATPTTVQLTPHLPVVRTGIKTLSIGADVVPNLSATVKSMILD